jgi:hypothetical protein
MVVAPPPDAAPVPASSRGTAITLLYASNLRGEYEAHPLGGLARRAGLAAGLRAEGTSLLQVDAGDTVLPALTGLSPDRSEIERRASLMIAGLGRLGLDAMVPGETDLALGPARLAALARRSRLPLLAANLKSGGKPWLPAHRLVSVAGIPVGLFGIVELAPGDLPTPLSVTDAVAAARTSTAALRARGARLVVGLFHLAGGVARARELARTVDGIDFMVVGHDGETLEIPVTEGATRILEAHHHGTYVGRLDLDVLPAEVGARNRIVRLEPTTPADPIQKASIALYVEETRRRIDAGKPAALAPPPAKPPDELWTYASNGACAMCHQKAVEHWQTTAHAAGLMTLQSKARGRDGYCFGCHLTAFQQPGGTRSLETAITYFAGVGCESCHGPSVKHVRTGKPADTHRQVSPKICLECHRADQQPDPFDFAAAMKLVLGPGHGDGGKGMR